MYAHTHTHSEQPQSLLRSLVAGQLDHQLRASVEPRVDLCSQTGTVRASEYHTVSRLRQGVHLTSVYCVTSQPHILCLLAHRCPFSHATMQLIQQQCATTLTALAINAPSWAASHDEGGTVESIDSFITSLSHLTVQCAQFTALHCHRPHTTPSPALCPQSLHLHGVWTSGDSWTVPRMPALTAFPPGLRSLSLAPLAAVSHICRCAAAHVCLCQCCSWTPLTP